MFVTDICETQSREPQVARRLSCPFWACVDQVCRAAAHPLRPVILHQVRYCCGDDFDDCAYFLSRALRSSRPHGLDREPLNASGK